MIAALYASSAASAHVIEIGRDGLVTIRAADTNWSGTPEEPQALIADPIVEADVPDSALTFVSTPPVPATLDQSFKRAAASANLNPALLEALVWQESRWRYNAVSRKGALGLTQLMPATARALLVDPLDASSNLEGGARYLRQMLDLFDGDLEKALAAYNAGPGRVRLARGVPPIAETRAYVASILDRVSLVEPKGVLR